MAIVMPEESTYELPPAGSHTAVCVRVVDLGTQTGQYGPKLQVLFSWELPDELMADGRPYTISRRYSLSSNRKSALRGDIEGWLGRVLTASDFGKFDLGTLLGTTCLVGVKHEQREDGRTFANVVSVMKRPKAVPERLPPINETVAFSLADRPFRQYDYELLPQWLRDTVARSPEFTAATRSPTPVSKATKQRVKAILAGAPAPKPGSVIEELDDEIPDFP